MGRVRGTSGNRVMGLALAVATLAPAPFAHAAGFKVLYAFQGTSDGGNPYVGLIADGKGNLYTTTYTDGQAGDGTVFELPKGGGGKALWEFKGSPGDGALSQSPLIMYKGNFYGATTGGGSANLGTVFELKKDGSETVLHSFAGGTDGQDPTFGLIRDTAGNLYGTTFMGGSTDNCDLGPNGCGTVFKLARNGKETVLHVFTGADGSYPSSALSADSQGNFFGTTALGGTSGYGTLFKLAANGTLTVLHSFTNGSDGGEPGGGLAVDAAGNFYGTTESGGDTNCSGGCGTIFGFSAGGVETTLYSFKGGSDGDLPVAGVTLDSTGNLYGTTIYGGSANRCSQNYAGCGIVYELKTDGSERVLYAFTGVTDGGLPYGNLLRRGRNLYGTTKIGGSLASAGTVFEVAP